VNVQKVVIQHYIPKCVLSNFSNDKEQVCEGLVVKNKIYQTSISNSMAERFVYEHSNIAVNLLEKFFARIENYIAPAIGKIISTLEASESNAREFNKVRNYFKKYIREFLIFYYRSGALLYEFGHDQNRREDRVILLLRKLMNSEYIRILGKTIFDNYSFSIIKSIDGNFIISDQYISTAALGIKNRFANVSNRQMGFKQVIILVPLSKYYYGVFFDGRAPFYIKKNKINVLNDNQVEEINRIIVNNSYIKAASYSKDALEVALSEFEFQSPVKIMAGYKSGLTTGAVLKKEIFFYKNDEEVMRVFESTEWLKYEHLHRNDFCVCGSNAKFKNCHMDLFDSCKRIMDQIKNKTDSKIYAVGNTNIVELPIDEWSGYTDLK
jgi:hypothetical protein